MRSERMLINFMFTNSPRGSKTMEVLPWVQYEVHDSQGNLLFQARDGIHNIGPGDYCIYGTRYLEGENLYFGQETFNIPEGDPGAPSIYGPEGLYHWAIMVYMILMPAAEKDPTPCPDMIPSEGNGEGMNKGLLLIMVLLILGVMSSQ